MPDENSKNCPVCEGALATPPKEGPYQDYWLIRCPRCGDFKINGWTKRQMQWDIIKMEKDDRVKLSAWIRTELPRGCEVSEVEDILQKLRNRNYEDVDKQRLLLRHLKDLTEYPGHCVQVDLDTAFPIIWAHNRDELMFHLKQLLHCGSIEMHEGTQRCWIVSMTPSGLASLDDRPRLSDVGYHAV